MKKQVIKFFITPNTATVYDGVSGNGPVSARLDAYTIKHFSEQVEAVQRAGINCYDIGDEPLNINLSDKWVQVWCLTENSDNATDHGFAKDDPLRAVAGQTHAPRELPEKFIRKFTKDGDKVTTVVKYNSEGDLLEEPIEVEWIADQGNYRYRRFGDIVSVLNTVCARCDQYANHEGKEALKKLFEAIDAKRKA